MRTLRRVDAAFRQPQTLNRLSTGKMLLRNLDEVVNADKAVPNGLGIDHEHRAMLALVEAAGVLNTNLALGSGFLHRLFQHTLKVLGAFVPTARARCIRSSLIRTNKYMMVKVRHICLDGGTAF